MEYELELEPLQEEESPPEISEQHYFQGIAIGHRNTEYYLRHFEQFNKKGPGITWHWPAFFFTFLWFLHRKMWGWAILYFLLPIPFAIVMQALIGASDSAQIIGGGIYLSIAYLVFPLFANALYYGHINNRIAKVKRIVTEKETRANMLAGDGGTSGSIVVVLVVAMIVAAGGILASVALPVYTRHSSLASVERALALAIEYQREVERYVTRKGQWPRSAANLGKRPQLDKALIERVTLKNGALYLRFAAEQSLAGKSLILIPEIDGGGRVMWICRGMDIIDTYLPPGCHSGR